jgi:hypothetical protein
VTFREAVEKFLREDCPTKCLERASYGFDNVLSFIGDMDIEHVHDGSLQRYKRARHKAAVRAADTDFGRTEMETRERKPYPLEWAEQTRLLAELPGHLERMALFDVNTRPAVAAH